MNTAQSGEQRASTYDEKSVDTAQNVVTEIEAYFCAKKNIMHKSAQIKRQMHEEINELIEILKGKERDLCLQLDQETFELCQDIELYLASLLHSKTERTVEANIANNRKCSFMDCKTIEKESLNDSKLVYTSKFHYLKAIMQNYGHLRTLKLKKEVSKEINSGDGEAKETGRLETFFKQLLQINKDNRSSIKVGSEIVNQSQKNVFSNVDADNQGVNKIMTQREERSADEFELLDSSTDLDSSTETESEDALWDDIEIISREEQYDILKTSYLSDASPQRVPSLKERLKEQLKAIKSKQKKCQEMMGHESPKSVETGASFTTVDEPEKAPSCNEGKPFEGLKKYGEAAIGIPAGSPRSARGSEPGNLQMIPSVILKASTLEVEKERRQSPSQVLKSSFDVYLAKENPEKWLQSERTSNYVTTPLSKTDILIWLKGQGNWLSSEKNTDKSLAAKRYIQAILPNKYMLQAHAMKGMAVSEKNPTIEWLFSKE